MGIVHRNCEGLYTVTVTLKFPKLNIGSIHVLLECFNAFNTFGFTQVVDSPTSGNSILDLFATNI